MPRGDRRENVPRGPDAPRLELEGPIHVAGRVIVDGRDPLAEVDELRAELAALRAELGR